MDGDPKVNTCDRVGILRVGVFSARLMSVLLKKIDHSTADYAVGELKHSCRLFLAARYEMKLVRHDDVGKNQESS